MSQKFSIPSRRMGGPTTHVNLRFPSELTQILDKYVTGQDEAKKKIAVAVFNHVCRRIQALDPKLSNTRKGRPPFLGKSNLLIAGPSGSGKTFMLRTLLRELDIPYFIADCTTMTEAGYVGSDVESCLSGLIAAAGNDMEKAKFGVVVLDEFDKITAKVASMNRTRDVGGLGVQQAILKIVEGGQVGVPPNGGRIHPDMKLNQFDTSGVLFVALGAFTGLDGIVKERMLEEKGAEAVESIACPFDCAEPEDFIKYGIIPELIGRFSTVTGVRPLSEDDLYNILANPESSVIRQYNEMLAPLDTSIEMNDAAMRLIAAVAGKVGTGARSLRCIVDEVLTDILYGITEKEKGKKIHVTKKAVEEQLSTRYGTLLKCATQPGKRNLKKAS